MTPLLGTKTPSAPVGDKSGGERRAPEPRPFRFSRNMRPETRDTAIAWRAAQASVNSEAFTKHESRLFFETRPLRPFGAPCGEKAELKVAEPKTEIRRSPRRARYQVTACLPAIGCDWLAFLLPGHGFPGGCFPLFPAISRHFSVGGGVLRSRCSSVVRWKSRKSVQNPASPRKMHEAQRSPPLPSPTGFVPFAAKGTHAEKGERSNLHFSPRGEAKCVRGPSGRGASRAYEKGASRLARAGVLDVRRARQASATKSWRSYRVLRPSGGEKCRLFCVDRVVFCLTADSIGRMIKTFV